MGKVIICFPKFKNSYNLGTSLATSGTDRQCMGNEFNPWSENQDPSSTCQQQQSHNSQKYNHRLKVS